MDEPTEPQVPPEGALAASGADSRPLLVRCTVRGCGEPLESLPEGSWGCGRGHRFDRAREGYVNLLQPTDSRSKHPGDSPETVAARVRVAAAGAESALLEALTAWVESAGLAPGAALLEVGCGTGELLAGLAAECDLDAYGSDLTVRSLRVAARRSDRSQGTRWFATNSDRGLPFPDASLALVLTVKAPKPFAEFARVLQPGGRALVATPAPDDLTELRTLTAGAALPRDPALAAAAAAAEAGLALIESFTVRTRRRLSAELCADLLATGYRGARRSEQGRLSERPAGPVTLSTTIQIFQRASTR